MQLEKSLALNTPMIEVELKSCWGRSLFGEHSLRTSVKYQSSLRSRSGFAEHAVPLRDRINVTAINQVTKVLLGAKIFARMTKNLSKLMFYSPI